MLDVLVFHRQIQYVLVSKGSLMCSKKHCKQSQKTCWGAVKGFGPCYSWANTTHQRENHRRHMMLSHMMKQTSVVPKVKKVTKSPFWPKMKLWPFGFAGQRTLSERQPTTQHIIADIAGQYKTHVSQIQTLYPVQSCATCKSNTFL